MLSQHATARSIMDAILTTVCNLLAMASACLAVYYGQGSKDLNLHIIWKMLLSCFLIGAAWYPSVIAGSIKGYQKNTTPVMQYIDSDLASTNPAKFQHMQYVRITEALRWRTCIASSFVKIILLPFVFIGILHIFRGLDFGVLINEKLPLLTTNKLAESPYFNYFLWNIFYSFFSYIMLWIVCAAAIGFWIKCPCRTRTSFIGGTFISLCAAILVPIGLTAKESTCQAVLPGEGCESLSWLELLFAFLSLVLLCLGNIPAAYDNLTFRRPMFTPESKVSYILSHGSPQDL